MHVHGIPPSESAPRVRLVRAFEVRSDRQCRSVPPTSSRQICVPAQRIRVDHNFSLPVIRGSSSLRDAPRLPPPPIFAFSPAAFRSIRSNPMKLPLPSSFQNRASLRSRAPRRRKKKKNKKARSKAVDLRAISSASDHSCVSRHPLRCSARAPRPRPSTQFEKRPRPSARNELKIAKQHAAAPWGRRSFYCIFLAQRAPLVVTRFGCCDGESGVRFRAPPR